MTTYLDRSGLKIAPVLADFVENEVLPGIGIEAERLWDGFAAVLTRFVPVNRALLAKRDDLQAQIDVWHGANAFEPAAYEAFLREIGYLVPEPEPFMIDTANVDAEVAKMAGPQLVVPALNTRFALNAANARWGSLYDALYGTDVLDAAPAQAGGYDLTRGDAVVGRVRGFLNETLPGWAHALVGKDHPELVARRGNRGQADGVLFEHNGLNEKRLTG